jgi:hypothetical protein
VLLISAIVSIQCRQRREERSRLRVALAVGEYWARDTAEKVGEQLAALEPLADTLVAELESGRIRPGDLPGRLAPMLAQAPPGAARLGVLFQPFAAGAETRLFSPCATRDGGPRTFQYADLGDYTLRPWYRLDLARTWGEPHRTADEPVPLVDYLRPFRLPGATEPSGLVRLEVPLEHFQGMLREIGLGFSGYAFLVSARTAFLAYPRAESIRAGMTLFDLARESRNPKLRQLAQGAVEARAGHAECTSAVTGQRTLAFLEPVPGARWSVGINLFREDLGLVPDNHRKVALLLVVLAVALAWVLAWIGFHGPWAGARSPWWTVATGSLAMAVGLGILFTYGYTMPVSRHPGEFEVMDPLRLERFKAEYGQLRQGFRPVKTEFIRTGVYLRTVEVTGPSQVKVNGLIWQKLPRGTPREQRGVTLPEALSGEVTLGEEKDEGDGVTQYYPFSVTLEPELGDANAYPFDRMRVRLRMWPRQMHGNQVLVPDTDSYPILTFGALPGLDPELEVPGWRVEGDEFVYLLEHYNSSMGVRHYQREGQSPELVLNVQLQRRFLGHFIMSFLPLLAVAGLLFTLFLTASKDGGAIRDTGYTYSNFLRTNIALFFSLVVAQFNIRSRIVATGVLYLEWYYFALYCAILVVSIEALLFARSERRLWRHDNALPKLCFWPALLGCFYAITALYLI